MQAHEKKKFTILPIKFNRGKLQFLKKIVGVFSCLASRPPSLDTVSPPSLKYAFDPNLTLTCSLCHKSLCTPIL